MLLTIKGQSFQDERSFRSYTGVGWNLYIYLRKSFEQEWLLFHQSVTKPDKDRKRIRGGGRKSKLPSVDDKLVFILHYFKSYPTMDVLSTNFGMSRSSACGLVHLLARILQKSLANLEVIPLRQLTDKEELLDYLKQLGDIETLLIDATERAHRRVQDKDKRRALFSGKKKIYHEKYGH